MKSKFYLVFLVSLLSAPAQAGTAVGNGGDGVIIYNKKNPRKILTVLAYDLHKFGLYQEADTHRASYAPNLQSDKEFVWLRDQTRLQIIDTLRPNKQGNVDLNKKCKQLMFHCSTKAKGKDKVLHQAIADSLAYHLFQLGKNAPEFANGILIRLSGLHFQHTPSDGRGLPPSFENASDAPRLSRTGQKLIGCARHTPTSGAVEWSEPCFSDRMPLSHSAAILVHESIYAALRDAGIGASESTSQDVRNVVKEVMLASPNYEPNLDLIAKFERLMKKGAQFPQLEVAFQAKTLTR